MRISGGLYKGRLLQCPKTNIRPVMARMREAIFSILYSRYGSLEGLRFLDVFCGSAIMAVEAASRGGSYVEVVESDSRKRKILEQNLAILDIPWKLHIMDALDYLRRNSTAAEAFDVIYLDPPFRMGHKIELLHAIRSQLLRPDGLVIMHLPKQKQEQPVLPAILHNGLALERCKFYGGSTLCLYGRSGAR